MTFYYQTTTRSSSQIPTEETIKAYEIAADKANWRIVQLPNGFYQTELEVSEDVWRDITRRPTLELAEAAIDLSIEHFQNKLEFAKGPKVVKTFK